jgi:hypothetical protein
MKLVSTPVTIVAQVATLRNCIALLEPALRFRASTKFIDDARKIYCISMELFFLSAFVKPSVVLKVDDAGRSNDDDGSAL